MPLLPEALIPVLAPFAPLFSDRGWLHAQLLLLGAMLAPRRAPSQPPCGRWGWPQSAASPTITEC
jgi:hypothetical protein